MMSLLSTRVSNPSKSTIRTGKSTPLRLGLSLSDSRVSQTVGHANPRLVYDGIKDPIDALLTGDAAKTQLSVWREGPEWKVSFTVTDSGDTSGEETHVGVDVGHNYILAATPDDGSAQSFLVSGNEYTFVRRYYRSLRDSLQEAGALRARNHVGNKEYRRIQDANHTLSNRVVEYASQFTNPVIKLEDLEGIRDGSEWHGVHS